MYHQNMSRITASGHERFLLMMVAIFVMMNCWCEMSMQQRAPGDLEKFAFEHGWRGFLDDNPQTYESQLFSVRFDNTTKIIDIYVMRTADGERMVRTNPMYIHLQGIFQVYHNLTHSLDFTVSNVTCKNQLLPNGLVEPNGCDTFSSFWIENHIYYYSLYSVDEEEDDLNFFLSIDWDKPTFDKPPLWKGMINPVDPNWMGCPIINTWKLENDYVNNLRENIYLNFVDDKTFSLQVNENIDFNTARTVCTLQENFLSMVIYGNYQYIKELGIVVAVRESCTDLQYWSNNTNECVLCSKREKGIGISSMIIFDTKGDACLSMSMQVENVGDTYNGVRLPRSFNAPRPQRYVAPVSSPENTLPVVVAISVVAALLIAVLVASIGVWIYICKKNQRPAYKPLE